MRLSARTLDRLADVIVGDCDGCPYRSGPDLIQFFRTFGERDLYGPGFPSRREYARQKVTLFNGTETMSKIVCEAFDFFGHHDCPDPEPIAAGFNHLLTRDGFRLVIEYRGGWMQGDVVVGETPYFEVRPLLSATVVEPASLSTVSHSTVAEYIGKATARLHGGDPAGAITIAYTLVEQTLKLSLTEAGASFNRDEGDLRKLYGQLRNHLNLNPASEEITAPLKPILDGLQKLVGGVYEIANKAGDRHARRYNPAPHHAKLAVNAALTLCEFIVDTREYQQARAMKKVS